MTWDRGPLHSILARQSSCRGTGWPTPVLGRSDAYRVFLGRIQICLRQEAFTDWCLFYPAGDTEQALEHRPLLGGVSASQLIRSDLLWPRWTQLGPQCPS